MPKTGSTLVESPVSKRSKTDASIENQEFFENDEDTKVSVTDDEDTEVSVTDDKDKVVTIDRIPERSSDTDSSDDSSDEIETIDKDVKQPAWIDEGDVFTCQEVVGIQGKNVNFGDAAGNDYKKSLEDKFQRVVGAPKWAQKRTTDDTTTKYLNSTGNLLKKSKLLSKDTIEIQKLKDLNKDTYLEGHKITSVLFHPTSTVGLIAGLSGVVSLVQVDGKENTKLQSIQYKKFPIHCSAYLNNGEHFIVGSSYHHYFYSHDLISGHSSRVSNLRITDITNTKKFRVSPDGKLIILRGKYGNLYVLSSVTKELICTLKMNGDVGAFDFIGSTMYSLGAEGEVYVWDMNARQCVHKFIDDGCLIGTAMAASPDGKMLACGSNTGVINIYNVNSLARRNPTPIKTVLNMVTHINCLKFNPTSELLCMSSHEKDNAIKLLHCPSMSIYSNFPNFQSKLNRVQCIDFSPNSGFFGFGDNHKTAHLFRLKYYGNY